MIQHLPCQCYTEPSIRVRLSMWSDLCSRPRRRVIYALEVLQRSNEAWIAVRIQFRRKP
jgi:hypothetical protein